MKSLDIYNAQVPSDINSICSIIGNIIDYLKENIGMLEEDSIFELKVILSELIVNAVKHGNKGDMSKHVNVIVGITENNYAFFIIEDQGDGYDYRCLLNKKDCLDDIFNIEVCDMKETGRGMMIVKNLCDSIRFNKKGNKVIVLKKLKKCKCCSTCPR